MSQDGERYQRKSSADRQETPYPVTVAGANPSNTRCNTLLMNVLISGGAGFIGTHLTRHLLKIGHAVTVLDNFCPQIHAGKRELPLDLRPHVKLVVGDVADSGVMAPALEEADCLVHLAAETGTGQSMYEVSRYERTNLAGTSLIYDLLTKSKSRKVERIVVASSRAIYGEGAYRCAEDGIVYPSPRASADKVAGLFDPLCPICGNPCETTRPRSRRHYGQTSFYGLTKQVQEQMVLLFGGFRYSIFRAALSERFWSGAVIA